MQWLKAVPKPADPTSLVSDSRALGSRAATRSAKRILRGGWFWPRLCHRALNRPTTPYCLSAAGKWHSLQWRSAVTKYLAKRVISSSELRLSRGRLIFLVLGVPDHARDAAHLYRPCRGKRLGLPDYSLLAGRRRLEGTGYRDGVSDQVPDGPSASTRGGWQSPRRVFPRC
jgi:hypothetical protein